MRSAQCFFQNVESTVCTILASGTILTEFQRLSIVECFSLCEQCFRVCTALCAVRAAPQNPDFVPPKTSAELDCLEFLRRKDRDHFAAVEVWAHEMDSDSQIRIMEALSALFERDAVALDGKAAAAAAAAAALGAAPAPAPLALAPPPAADVDSPKTAIAKTVVEMLTPMHEKMQDRQEVRLPAPPDRRCTCHLARPSTYLPKRA